MPGIFPGRIADLPTLVRFAVYRATYAERALGPENENITECTLSLTAYNYSGARSTGSLFEFGNVTEINLPKDGWNISTPAAKNGGNSDARPWAIEFKAEGFPPLDVGYFDALALQQYFRSHTISAEWVAGWWDNTEDGITAALMGDVDLPARFSSMAASMTDYLRSGPTHQLARGGRVELLIFVSIRWIWLSGPAVLVLASVLFTISTIVRNRRSCNAPVWKSSALAVLACAYDEESSLIRSGIKDIEEMKETAKDSVVRLE
ncbi:hypothetical protein CDD83_10819 [Cordyceps sp. RAO-2017]|nr:hypothetical protein CDD83_10819 [Cordyceps sp. RAO-2017]